VKTLFVLIFLLLAVTAHAGESIALDIGAAWSGVDRDIVTVYSVTKTEDTGWLYKEQKVLIDINIEAKFYDIDNRLLVTKKTFVGYTIWAGIKTDIPISRRTALSSLAPAAARRVEYRYIGTATWSFTRYQPILIFPILEERRVVYGTDITGPLFARRASTPAWSGL